ncbi:glutathione S-transferase [Shewanella woodyi]|uniref:glutathione S-transferase n=1 Tax=Shewanella woodyi TaxID=60961 RepID=UPI0037481F50
MPLPILYSLQHCPYAMRARMGLLLANQTVLLRAIVMKNKPQAMLEISPKGTVPVLIVEDSNTIEVIDESLDIMLWSLNQDDPHNLLHSQTPEALPQMLELIEYNDKVFKPLLEQYKSAKRYHKDSELYDRSQCEVFIKQLELKLNQHQFIMGDTLSLADYALLPFVRQFARADRHKYLAAPYPKLQHWLKAHLDSPLFSKAMAKYSLWLDSDEEHLFGEKSV